MHLVTDPVAEHGVKAWGIPCSGQRCASCTCKLVICCMRACGNDGTSVALQSGADEDKRCVSVCWLGLHQSATTERERIGGEACHESCASAQAGGVCAPVASSCEAQQRIESGLSHAVSTLDRASQRKHERDDTLKEHCISGIGRWTGPLLFSQSLGGTCTVAFQALQSACTAA